MTPAQRKALVDFYRLEIKQNADKRTAMDRELERDMRDSDRMARGGGINRFRGGIAAIGRLNRRYRRPGQFAGRAGFNNRQRRGWSNGFGL